MNPEIRTWKGIEVQIFDLRLEPVFLDPRKWTPHHTRKPEDARGLCLHQWDTKVGTTMRNRKILGEPEALARRALRIPAQLNVGVTPQGNVPVVAIAHPLERYIYGSDGANQTHLSMEVMGAFPFEEKSRTVHHTPLTAELQAAVTVGIQVATELLQAWSGKEGPWELITHRQACNSKGDHTNCCGEGVLSLAIQSGVQNLVPNPDLVLDPRWGKPWPASWRTHLIQETQDSANPVCVE